MVPLSKQSESRSTGAGMALRPCSSMWLGRGAFYGLNYIVFHLLLHLRQNNSLLLSSLICKIFCMHKVT